MKNLVIFGVGDIAQIARYYFEKDTKYRVVAFCLDDEYIKEDRYDGLPLISFSNLNQTHPPSENEFFAAISYSEMNKLRHRKFDEAQSKGYAIASYVSPDCTYRSQFKPGLNCFIFEDNTIQPFVKIGDNVTMWSGNHIGHHSIIESHNFISSHVVISGHCTIKSHSFLGVNATLAHNVTIEKETLVGAGAVISKDTITKGVYVAPRSVLLEKTSDQFKL